MRDIYLLGSCRTPIGRFNGALQGLPAPAMAAVCLRTALLRAGVDAGEVAEVLCGNVLQANNGFNVARQAGLMAGLPQQVPAATINMVCGSGLRAIIDAARQVALGEAEVVLAAGTESMSRAPYYLPTARWGQRLGSAQLVDGLLRDGLEDPSGYHMGDTAEALVAKYGIAREEQDLLAYESQQKSHQATTSGWLAPEIVPIPQPAGEADFAQDEHPRVDTTLEKLGRLKPVFKENGSVTAGNSSGICDGAAAVVVASGEAVQRLGLQPEARLTGWAYTGCDPRLMGLGPAKAIPKLLAQTGQSLDDFAAFEINEAFAAQVLAVLAELPLDRARLNQHGGALALGHPLGASGTRIVVTLLGVLKRLGGGRGLASLCCGGGQGLALALEV